MARLRKFESEFIDRDFSKLQGLFKDTLFYGCKFSDVSDLHLVNCVLDRAEFNVDSIAKAMDFSLTLNCHSFRDVKYSELLFDLLCVLMTMSTGNDEKREKLKAVVGKKRYDVLMRALRDLD